MAIFCLFDSPVFAQAPPLDEALYLFNYKEYDGALAAIDEIAEELCEDPGLAEQCTHAYIMRANIYRNRSYFEKAADALDKASDYYETYLGEDHPLGIRLLSERGFLNNTIGNVQRVDEITAAVLALIEKHSFGGKTRAAAFILSGINNSIHGNYEDSIQDYQEAIQSVEDLDRSIEVINLLSQAYNNIGVCYRRLGAPQEAMENYRKNLDLVIEAFGENHLELAYVYNSMGTIYYTLGDYGTAGDYFRRSAELFRANLGDDNPGLAASLNNAGVSYIRIGNLEGAAEMLEQAQAIKVKTLGLDHPETAIGFSNLSDIYLQNENYEAARINYERSYQVRENIHGPSHPTLVAPLVQMGVLFTRTGETENARIKLNQALEIVLSRLGANHPDVWGIYTKLGYTYLKEKKFGEAGYYYKKAYNMILEESGLSYSGVPDYSLLSHPLEFMQLNQQMADLSLERYRNGESFVVLYDAFRHYRFASDVVDHLQFRFQSEASKLNLIDQNYSVYTNAIETSYSLFNETGDERWLDEMFYISELSRARIALELLQDLDARSFAGLPPQVLETEQAFNTEIAGIYQRLHSEQEKADEADSGLVSAYRDTLFQLKRDLAEFTSQLEQDYPVYYELKYAREITGKDDVANLLDEGQALIKYVLAENHFFVMLFDGGGMAAYKFEIDVNFNNKITSLRDAAVSGNKEELATLGHTLYQILLEPIMDEIAAESLIIIPDQALYYLPFEMLFTEPAASDGEYYDMPFLIRQKKVMYAPSATMLNRMVKTRSVQPKNLLAVAPFSRSLARNEYNPLAERHPENLSPLPLTRYETRMIAESFRKKRSFSEYFRPHKINILYDREATVGSLEAEELHQYSYLHFATHAFVNEANPSLSGIAFWGDEENDGILYVRDIYNLRMNANLVVLGACDTGLGSVVRGEGLIGFTRAFLFAGASNLVVSMWRVSDQPTSRLMIRFYDHIRDGYSYSEALHLAKIELVNHPEYASPKNWAAFILQGM